MDRPQTIDYERRQQQHYTSHSPHSHTWSWQNHTSQSRQIHSLLTCFLAHAQLIPFLVHHTDSSTSFLESHQVHVRCSCTSHREPRNALHNNSHSYSLYPTDLLRPASAPPCSPLEPRSQTPPSQTDTLSRCPSC